MTELKILCPFCNQPYTREMLDMLNDSYGCETGCKYYRIEITCTNCKKIVYVKGDFGSYENDKEKEEYLSEITEDDIKQATTNH